MNRFPFQLSTNNLSVCLSIALLAVSGCGGSGSSSETSDEENVSAAPTIESESDAGLVAGAQDGVSDASIAPQGNDDKTAVNVTVRMVNNYQDDGILGNQNLEVRSRVDGSVVTVAATDADGNASVPLADGPDLIWATGGNGFAPSYCFVDVDTASD